jgi:hypothetical protein
MAKLPRFTKGLCQAAGASSKWISSPLISFFRRLCAKAPVVSTHFHCDRNLVACCRRIRQSR